ncbi:hypothetical protein, partial [Blautia stercoris]|uniref:hypothetical protein n=2 Tax=Blautia stercoris TaxID=871664 RepID=UPI0040286183
CQWELSTPTDRSIPLTRRLVLCALEAGGMLICVQISILHYNTENYGLHLLFFQIIMVSEPFGAASFIVLIRLFKCSNLFAKKIKGDTNYG